MTWSSVRLTAEPPTRGFSRQALSAAVTSLGKKPGDLEIAEAYDASGASP